MQTEKYNENTVYVDITAIEKWQANITEIANTNETIFSELSSIIQSVDSSWQGNSATSFTEDYNSFLTEISQKNKSLADFNKLLQTVVETLKNE